MFFPRLLGVLAWYILFYLSYIAGKKLGGGLSTLIPPSSTALHIYIRLSSIKNHVILRCLKPLSENIDLAKWWLRFNGKFQTLQRNNVISVFHSGLNLNELKSLFKAKFFLNLVEYKVHRIRHHLTRLWSLTKYMSIC